MGAITARMFIDDVLTGDFPANGLSIASNLNAVDTFDFSILVDDLNGRVLDLQDDIVASLQATIYVQIYVDGELTISGIVDNIGLNIDKTPAFSFSVNSEMYELSQIRAKSNASYEDQQVLGILADLLSYAPGWRIGAIITMPDPLIKTTIDLRGEKRLLAQVKKLVEAVPNLFFRYGGQINGYDRIDLGTFDEHRYPYVSPSEITTLNQQVNYSSVIRRVECFGGTYKTSSGNTRRINLSNALAYQPSLATDPDYPIVMNKGVYVVQSADLNVGEETVETFSEIVPLITDSPTAASVQAAGYALYLKARAMLEQSSSFENTWKTSTTSLPPDTHVGDRVFLQGNAQRIFHDPLSSYEISMEIGHIARWFRISGITHKFTDTDDNFDLKISDNFRLDAVDPIIQLYEAQPKPEYTVKGDNPVATKKFDVLHVNIPTGLNPDCFNSDEDGYYNGRTYVIPIGTVPVGSTTILRYGEPFSDVSGVEFSILQEPVLPSTGVQVCVSYQRGWNSSYSIDAFVLVEYQ